MYTEMHVSEECNVTSQYKPDVCVINGGINNDEAFRVYLNDLNFTAPSLHLCIEKYNKSILSFTSTQDVIIVSALNLCIVILVGMVICLVYKYIIRRCKYRGIYDINKSSYRLKSLNRENDDTVCTKETPNADNMLNVVLSSSTVNETSV